MSLMSDISPTFRTAARDLLDFIDASPSPWHVVATCAARLLDAGFTCLDERERWSLAAGGRYFVVRGGASLIAFVVGSDPEQGFRIVGAHTDSPGLRLKPRPALGGDGLLRLGVEIYGGPILATFADRDLGLAGRVCVRSGNDIATHLLAIDEPLLRLPNLAIHMNRDANEQGLKLHKQNELPLILGLAGEGEADAQFRTFLAGRLGVKAEDLLSWELCACDTQKGAFWGAGQEFIASRQLDNLASCHAALSALLATPARPHTALCALFDHEEVGSESAGGAAGSFIGDVLARIGNGLDDEGRRVALANSFLVSADMAHAYQPSFPGAYEPGHKLLVNGGPAIKINANQRYSSNAETAARFAGYCRRAGVPCQQYAHRTDLGCGSTIGPLVAARLGIASVDIGAPLWAMHSIRESAGVLDHAWTIAALGEALADRA